MKLHLFFFLILFVISCNKIKDGQLLEINECCDFKDDFIESLISLSEIKISQMVAHSDNFQSYPQFYSYDGTINYSSINDWTSGFFPGLLWLLYENTGKEFWKSHAINWTAPLKGLSGKNDTHDLGFMFVPSFSAAYKQTNNKYYKSILIDAANTLLNRYNPNVKAIKSWDNTRWSFPVIIDNLINLELLFLAWELTGEDRYLAVALDHLKTTEKNHIRDDGSVYHVVDFQEGTGQKINVAAGQGYSINSTWSRGQAWGILGFSIAYQYTRNEHYLNLFNKLLTYFLDHLPEDGVPAWDFIIDSKRKNDKDSSSTFIVSSALLKMSPLVNADLATFYSSTAIDILNKTFQNGYISRDKNYPGLTKHSIGHRPRNIQVDVTLIYADYYLLQALTYIKK